MSFNPGVISMGVSVQYFQGSEKWPWIVLRPERLEDGVQPIRNKIDQIPVFASTRTDIGIELVYNLEMCLFFAMITVIFMIIELFAIQKNHGNHIKPCFFEIGNDLLKNYDRFLNGKTSRLYLHNNIEKIYDQFSPRT